MKKLYGLLTIAALALAGCDGGGTSGGGGGTPEGTPGTEGGQSGTQEVDTTLAINLGAEPKTLDPSLVDALPASQALRGLMEGLVYADKDLNPQPAVAESWEHNEDYTVWTFHLRPDAKWHNGDTVTASDFKFGAERVCTPSTNAPYAQIVFSFLDGGKEYYDAGGMDEGLSLDSVKVVDEDTVEYHMDFPAPFFLTMVSFAPWYPLHQGTVEEHGAGWSTSPDTFVGNGAFKLTEYHSRDRMEMVKTDTYWDRDEIFWSEITMYMIDDKNTEMQAFGSGDLDITEGVAIPQVPYWKDRPEYRVVPGLATYYVTFNTNREPFTDPRVRRAFNMVIDRDLIVNRVTKAGEIPSDGFVPHGMRSPREGQTYRDVAPDYIPGEPQIEKAKQLLAEAGFDEDNPLPTLEYLYNTQDTNKLIAEQLQFMWRDAFGVDVRLQNAEWGVTLGRIARGDYQFARASWIADYADPLNFLSIFTTGNTKNGPKFNNERYDNLIEQARYEGDPIKREDLFIEAEGLLVEEEAAVAPIYTYALNFLAATDLRDLHMNSLSNILYVRAYREAE